MTLTVNGEARARPDGETLAALLADLALDAARVAVEHNGALVARGRYVDTPLADGDRLEIVHFVGGG